MHAECKRKSRTIERYVNRDDGGDECCVVRCLSQCGHLLTSVFQFPPQQELSNAIKSNCYHPMCQGNRPCPSTGWLMILPRGGPSCTEWKPQVYSFSWFYMHDLLIHDFKQMCFKYLVFFSECFLSSNSGLFVWFCRIVFIEDDHYGVTKPSGDTESLPNYLSILRKNSFTCGGIKVMALWYGARG